MEAEDDALQSEHLALLAHASRRLMRTDGCTSTQSAVILPLPVFTLAIRHFGAGPRSDMHTRTHTRAEIDISVEIKTGTDDTSSDVSDVIETWGVIGM